MSARGAGAERVEWALGLASGAVIAGLVGYLVHDGLTGAEAPPELRAEIVAPAAGGAAGQVRFLVRNDGGKTATAVSLSMTVRDAGGAVVDEQRLVLDYLPGRSEATGGFLLPEGTDPGRAEVAVEGYLDP